MTCQDSARHPQCASGRTSALHCYSSIPWVGNFLDPCIFQTPRANLNSIKRSIMTIRLIYMLVQILFVVSAYRFIQSPTIIMLMSSPKQRCTLVNDDRPLATWWVRYKAEFQLMFKNQISIWADVARTLNGGLRKLGIIPLFIVPCGGKIMQLFIYVSQVLTRMNSMGH